jgi:NAD(P)-dependent dehydrogenase (short-subunit alcohol dehydrogenase family)
VGRLAGRVAVVTGAGAPGDALGNGRAVALRFAREGARVVVNDLDAAAADRTLAMIEQAGGAGSTYPGDVSVAEVAEGLIAHAVDRWGALDVLHNNVGISGRGSVVEASVELWERVLSVNVTTMMLTGKFAVPVMAERGGGAILNVGSIAALRPSGRTPYSASKGAVIALTRSMALDHAAQGIRVNCILPGPLFTPHAGALDMSHELRARRRDASPLGIEGTAEDIAAAAVFLASDDARFITGVVLPVDGGVLLRGPDRH